MKVKIVIETKTFIRFVLVVAGFFVTAVVLWQIRSALAMIFAALFIALALNPPVTRLAKILPGKSRVAATATAYVVVVALLSGFILMVAPPVIEQTSKFIRSLPGVVDQISQQRGVVDDFLTRYNLHDQFDGAVQNTKDELGNISRNIGNTIVTGASALFSGIANLLFILVLAFLMLIEGPAWLKRIWGLYEDPDRLDRHRTLIERMYHVVTGYVNGQLMVAGIAALFMGVVLTIMLAVFNQPLTSAIPLAAIVFVCGMIPMIGALLATIIVTATLLFTNITMALIVMAIYIIYQQVENNFIQPTVQSRTVDLSALTILSSILIGVSLIGPLGGVVAIPVAGCLRVLLLYSLERAKRIREERRSKKRGGAVGRFVSKLKDGVDKLTS